MKAGIPKAMLIRSLALALAIPAAFSSVTSSCLSTGGGEPDTISDTKFGNLVTSLSEDGGYFWSNNYISNETSYLHVLDELDARRVEDGVYVGVGPNQNFTYIAALEPQLAFIVDIRRQNMVEHLLFKLLTEDSETRDVYLSRLLARPLTQPLARDATIAEIVAAIESTAPDESFYEKQLAFVLGELENRPELGLTDQDRYDLQLIYREFFRQGLEIKYDSWRSFFFPSLKEFILEIDSHGEHRNWLASDETYRRVREMQLENRIIPIVGDFAGNQAFRRLGRFLDSRRQTVTTFYVSNVEFYLFRQRKWSAFVDNVKQLPTSESSVFIRAYANLHRPHPAMVDDHITISLVQNIHTFLRSARDGRYRTLWDVVTAESF